jgi:hypothetical protein
MGESNKIRFHYLKANDFRVVHVDGLFGGPTPSGDIFVSLFSQRPPMPQITVQPLNENGQLGDEIMAERVSKDGIIRQLEVGLTMRPEVAESIVKWLQDRIAEMKQKTEESKKT